MIKTDNSRLKECLGHRVFKTFKFFLFKMNFFYIFILFWYVYIKNNF